MDELLKAFSSESVVFLILGAPVLALFLMIIFIGKALNSFEKKLDRLTKVILIMVLHTNGERRTAKEVAKRMARGEEDLDDAISNL